MVNMESGQRLLSVTVSGKVHDIATNRFISLRDSGFDGKYGEASVLRVMPNIAMLAQRISNAQLGLTNSSMMWFEANNAR